MLNIQKFYMVLILRLCVLNGFYLAQHQQIAFYNRGTECLLRGTDWVLI